MVRAEKKMFTSLQKIPIRYKYAFTCTFTLPPGVNPIAVDKYIYLSIYTCILNVSSRSVGLLRITDVQEECTEKNI
jgi:hypothetical protein